MDFDQVAVNGVNSNKQVLLWTAITNKYARRGNEYEIADSTGCIESKKISGLNIPKKTDAEVWILCSAD